MIPLAIYIIALFFLGIGDAVIAYHILRYRDPDDNSGLILVLYFILVLAVLIGTAVLIDWNAVFVGGL